MKLLIALAVVALSALVASQEAPETKEEEVPVGAPADPTNDEIFVVNIEAVVEKYNTEGDDDDDDSGDRTRRSAGLGRGLFGRRAQSYDNGYNSGYGEVRDAAFAGRGFRRSNEFNVAPSAVFASRFANRIVPARFGAEGFGARRLSGVVSSRVSAFGVPSAARVSAFGLPRDARVSAFGLPRDARVSAFGVPNYYQYQDVAPVAVDNVYRGFRAGAPATDVNRFSFVRFFTSFTPQAARVTQDNVYVRSYVRSGSFDDCLSDFRRLRLTQVKAISSQTMLSDSSNYGQLSGVRSVVASRAQGLFGNVQGESTVGYFGVMRDFPYQVYAIREGCAVDGLSGFHDCIIFSGATYPYAKTVRRFVYVHEQTSAVSDSVNTVANRYAGFGAGYRVNNRW